MGYATSLEARIARKTTRAITDFEMIEDGDRVMVGLSGGKDSWALIQILEVLRQRAPIDFSIVAVNVDSGYEGYQHDLVARTCEERGWEFHHVKTSIGETIDTVLDADATPCSLCARLRRGVLYRMAGEVGATKIALGHHADDFVETLLLNVFFAGALKAMPARLRSDDGRHVVIRPLVYVLESEAREYAKAAELPIIGCCCPACGDLSLQRQRIKRLIMDLEREHPDLKQSLLKSLGNVQPRHLLDRRLNPPSAAVAGPAVAGPVVEPAAADVGPSFSSGDRHAPHPSGRPPALTDAVRAVLQRVSSASVTVGERVIGAIGSGLLVLIGIEAGDGPDDRDYIVTKIRDVRIFPDAADKMNRSVADTGGAVLVVSQFTLCGDVRKGRRPSFDQAAPPAEAKLLYEDTVRALRETGMRVETGEFQAMMQVALVNDGPVTILLDSRRRF